MPQSPMRRRLRRLTGFKLQTPVRFNFNNTADALKPQAKLQPFGTGRGVNKKGVGQGHPSGLQSFFGDRGNHPGSLAWLNAHNQPPGGRSQLSLGGIDQVLPVKPDNLRTGGVQGSKER